MKYLKLLLLILFMNLSCLSFAQNRVVAHRGAWKNTGAPENSIASLIHAFEMGCGGTEFDINMTKDGILVINHDNDYFGKIIEKHTYAELNETKLANGEDLPTYDSFLKIAKKYPETLLFAEIKASPSGIEKSVEVTKAVYKMTKKHKLLKRTVFISFSYEGILELVSLNKEQPVQYLGGSLSPQQLKAAGISGLDYNHKVLSRMNTWIDEARELGLSTNVWTVDDIEKMKFFLNQKIDFLTTDEPEMAMELDKK